ncbi:MAG TPA: ATP-binding protein [Candidatus Dormibacteraeota bacterium]|jgi:signal transduction histidine kinase|nr:ATP-binding protein [Candidatus Dormibacteraeota bacterium]
MMFRGALVRLAAQYFVLLVLILGCFDFIVYFTVSQALQGRVDTYLQHSVQEANHVLSVTGDTINATPLILDPSYADTFMQVLQLSGNQVVMASPTLQNVFKNPALNPALASAKSGLHSETQVYGGQQLFVVDTSPIRNPKSHKVVGVLQVAQPISWVNDSLSRLIRQLVLASVIGIVLGALASLLMAFRSLRPISRAFQRQREFVADASHELRTPLTLIRTNVEAWLRRASGPNRAYARNIIDEVEQLNRIVGDLTTLALADARQLPIVRQPLELNAVVSDLMTQAQPLADERGVRLRPELNGGVQVDADPARVRQLLLILMDNALRHTASGGLVSVGVLRENGHARITVTDNGEGIPAADLPHIFERFYRADKARSRENGGSGLGLAIAKWIVDAHRGEIAVKSAEGKGTEVAINLPAIT